MGAMAKRRDCPKKIAGLNSRGYDLPGESRGKQFLEGRFHPVEEIDGKSTVGGVPGMEGSGETSFFGNEIDIALHPPRQCFGGRVLAGKVFRGIRARIDLRFEYRDDQVRPLREMTVHRSDANSCSIRNFPDRGIHSGSLEYNHRGAQ